MLFPQCEFVHDLLCDTEAAALCDGFGDGFGAKAGDRIHRAIGALFAGEVVLSSAHGFEQLLKHHGFELLCCVLKLCMSCRIRVCETGVESVQRGHSSTSISASRAPAD